MGVSQKYSFSRLCSFDSRGSRTFKLKTFLCTQID